MPLVLHPRLGALLAALALGACGAADDGGWRQGELGGWEYRWGDSPRDGAGRPTWLAEPDGWLATATPGAPPGRDDRRSLWLRARLPQELPPSPHLYLLFVDQRFEAWLGGERIYRYGELDGPRRGPEGGRPWHLIPLGEGAGGQVLHLRIYSEHATIGLGGGRAYLGEKAALVRRMVLRYADVFVLGFVFAIVGFFALLIFFTKRTERPLIYFAVLSLLGGSYTLSMAYSPIKQLFLDAPRLWWSIELGSLYLLVAFFYALLHASMPTLRMRSAFRGLYLAHAAYAVGALALAAGGVVPLFKTLLPYEVLVTGGLLLGIAASALAAVRGDRGGRTFLVGFAAVASTGLHDALVDMRLLARAEHYWMDWGYFVLVLCMGLLMVRRYVGTMASLGDRSHELESTNRELLRARARLGEAATGIVRDAGELRKAAAQQFELSSRQAAALAQTSSTAAEIAQTSRSVNGQAEGVLALAERSGERSDTGRKVVEDVARAMHQVSGQVARIATSMTALAERTQQIGEINATVEELAEQSNLLALNASIEAAKAGESGLGFSVVAAEMRKLAEQSKSSAQRVRALLSEVREGTRSALEVSEEGNRAAQQAVALAQEAGGAIAALAQAILESSQAARSIGQSTGQQTVGVEQIVAAMGEVSSAMGSAVEGTRRIDEVAQNLLALSTELAALVEAGAAARPRA